MTEQKRRIGWVAALLVLALLAGALYAARLVIARAALVSWLRSHGAPATARFEALGLGGLAVSLQVGDPRNPDLVAPRAEVGYGLSSEGLDVRSIRLVRPTLRAQAHGGKLSFGSLDPLVAYLRSRPSRPNAPQPRIEVQDGIVRLATDYGALQIAGDAQLSEGRLTALSAKIAPTHLTAAGVDADLGAGAAELQTRGDAALLSADIPVVRLKTAALEANDLRLQATAQGRYPGAADSRLSGPATANLRMSFARATAGGAALRAGLLSADYQGRLSGSLRAPSIAGVLAADLSAAAADAAGRLSLSQVHATARGPAGADGRRLTYDLVAQGTARGRIANAPSPARGDPAPVAALKRAARDFGLDAEGVAVTSDGGQVRAALKAPLRLTAAGGASVVLAPDRSGYRLTTAGGGLPSLKAAIDRVAIGKAASQARVRLQTAVSAGPVEGADLAASGRVRLAGGAVTFDADRCARLSARQAKAAGRTLTHVEGELCPSRGPLLKVAGGGGVLAGAIRQAAAESASDQLRARGVSGDLQVVVRGSALSGTLRNGHGELVDLAAPARLTGPVRISTNAEVSRTQAHADFAVQDMAGRELAHGQLSQDIRSGRGGLQFQTPMLEFAAGGLQPAQISKLLAIVGSPADGRARLQGQFGWTAASAVTSAGRLDVPGLDFKSPLGRVTGLSGQVALTSLLPLRTAPDQHLRAQSIETPIGPLKDAVATFQLDDQELRVSEAHGAALGGVVRVRRLDDELSGRGRMRGVIELEGVQLGDLVKASPLADRVHAQAKVDGELPFEMDGDKLRFSGGWLRAVEPGRLSISRGALTDVAGSGGVAVAPGQAPQASPGFSSFAYQALEDLAFNTLEAKVQSQSNGRLQVVFHIVGRHDPPQHQEIRVPLLDFLQRKFMNRDLPLPSGTGVDLTLDTTLNLNDLVAQYRDLIQPAPSATVQH